MTAPSAKAYSNNNNKSSSSSSTMTLPNGDAWQIDQSEGGLIGKGRFGVVRRCYKSSDGTAAACKIVTVPSDPFDAECVGREVKAMQYLCAGAGAGAAATEASSHEALVRLHGVLALDSQQQQQQEDQQQEQGKKRNNCNSNSKSEAEAEAEAEAVAVTMVMVMVMELCEGGDLFDRIAANNAEGRVFSEREAARVMQQVMEGLAFCHAQGVAHRDVKPDNILFVDGFSGRIKIIDFGQAAFFRVGMGMTGLVGTPYYVAPEIIEGQGQCEYTEKVDVWSAGVVLYMMLCGIPPFRGDSDSDSDSHSVHDIFRSILRGRLCFRSHMSPSVRSLLRLMLQRHPSSRPSASHLLQHAWFLEHRHRIA